MGILYTRLHKSKYSSIKIDQKIAIIIYDKYKDEIHVWKTLIETICRSDETNSRLLKG